jgi:hypothetical protein
MKFCNFRGWSKRVYTERLTTHLRICRFAVRSRYVMSVVKTGRLLVSYLPQRDLFRLAFSAALLYPRLSLLAFLPAEEEGILQRGINREIRNYVGDAPRTVSDGPVWDGRMLGNAVFTGEPYSLFPFPNRKGSLTDRPSTTRSPKFVQLANLDEEWRTCSTKDDISCKSHRTLSIHNPPPSPLSLSLSFSGRFAKVFCNLRKRVKSTRNLLSPRWEKRAQ